jgi:GT2 family glycosyltransferase
MPPLISIIVPHLNQPEHLERALRSLFDQDFPMERAEIVVVDNGSRASPEAVTGRFPSVRLAHSPAPGPGPARNRGAELTSAPILAFTDADCVVDRNWTRVILDRFDADPGLAIIGGDVRVLLEAPGQPSVAEAYEMLYAFPQKQYIERQGFSGAGNMAVRREIFAEVGPFAGIHIAEDTDWGQRATAMGHRTVYVPEMIVHHPARRTLVEIYAKWDRNVSHHYAAFARTPAGKAKWIARTGAIALSPLGEAVRILRSPRLPDGATRWRCLRGLAAVRLYRARKMLAVTVRPETRAASTQWNR